MKFEEYISELIDEKTFPGITIFAGSHEGVPFEKSYGKIIFDSSDEDLTTDSIYDVASLTKPLATALVSLILIEKGEFRENSSIGSFFEGFSKEIKISHLLTHSSGIQAWYPLYLRDEDPLTVIKELGTTAGPGRKVIYSCIGYVLLKFIIEKVTGTEFSSLTEELVIKKLGLNNTFFKVPSDKIKKCIPTEEGNLYEKILAEQYYPDLCKNYNWREYTLCGEVNDGNSFFLDGSSGNAGLFSSAGDIYKLSREFYPEFSTLLSPESTDKFWENLTPFKKSHRSMGFKLNSSFITSGGKSLSKKAIGHSGFTGTSIWMEPESANVFILLTNRIYPKYDRRVNFNKIRRKLHKLIKKDLNIK